MKRAPQETQPPTYTAGEVARIFSGEIDPVLLKNWDLSALFRPSYYLEKDKLMATAERDAHIFNPSFRGNPRRRYTYQDLVWLQLLIYVKVQFERVGVPNARRKSAKIIASIREITNDQCPSAARLLFVGKTDVYLLLDDREVAQHLGKDNQLAMRALLTGSIFAEVKGRIAVLEAAEEISALNLAGSGN